MIDEDEAAAVLDLVIDGLHSVVLLMIKLKVMVMVKA